MTDPQTQLLGRVLNESGDPVSGTDVVAVSGKHFQRHPIDVVLSEGNGLYRDAHFAVTDADGRFEIAGSLEQDGLLSVSVITEGYAPLRMPHEWLPEERPFDLGDLIVSKGHSVSGTVVDDAGKPLEDVQVLMAIDRGVPGCLQSYPGRGIPLTRTDADGRFTAGGLLPGRWLFIFDKPGYRVTEAQGNLFNDLSPDDLAITLGRGRSICGQVTNVPDEIDGPLMVEARPIHNSVDYCKQFPSRARPRRAMVQADGSFLIEGLNEEEFIAQIKPGTMHGYHPEWTIASGKLDVWLVVGPVVEENRRFIQLSEFYSCRVEAGTTDVELPWVGKANLSARVVNEAGEPIEEFTAELKYETGFGQQVDEHKPAILPGGQIDLRDYPFWDMHLSFWEPPRQLHLVISGAAGFEDQSVEIQEKCVRGVHNDFGDIVLEKEKPKEEAADSETEPMVEKANDGASHVVGPAPELHGFTVSIRESDRPVIGAELKMMRAEHCTQDAEYYNTEWQGVTDARGTYRFRKIPAGDVVLHVMHDDRNMVNRLQFRVGPDMETVDWLLDNNTITGLLVDPNGKPHAWRRIGIKTDIAGYCQRNSDGITHEDGRGELTWFWSNQAVHETWTDGDGNFHLRGLVADIPIKLYTRHGEIVDIDMELEPLKDGEHREGVVFVAGYTGNKGWRGSKNWTFAKIR
ncbi:MAG: hypothetical protein GKR89_35485 [Candidatus Latescibacteria bacterium]|nr:hypothetical protein [Candidatus Latescibacterota bacterium]